jgi:CRISPR-associated protein Csm1
VEALGRWAGANEMPASISPGAGEQFSEYGRLLSSSWKPDGKGDKLLSIFSLVQPADGNAQQVKQVFVPARPLSLEAILPGGEGDKLSRLDLWRDFTAELGQLPKGDGRFDTFAYLYHKYAWAVPCTYGEAGVSLYEEFKALAALVHASGGSATPADAFLLVGGDIPGIQSFVYTITSKGAAKGLRGRSFFLQLLGDAVVRRLVKDLELCQANVVYSAGGNFTLLAPAGSETVLEAWQAEFNRILLDEFEGDLYLALAWETLLSSAVRTLEFVAVRERLGANVAAAKSRRFAELVKKEDGWTALFEPKGKGGLDHCQICQREPAPGERLVPVPTEAGEPVNKCAQCLGFEQLARDIARDPLWMIVAETGPTKEGGWQSTLARLTGFVYRFEHELEKVNGPGVIYSLNSTELQVPSTHGFRFIANVTPRIDGRDLRWVYENHPDLELPRGEPIKDFALMALQSEGIPRVGVLRMDVDNLGAVFAQHLRGSMAQVSALSGAMDLFFSGHLNRICAEANGSGEHNNVLYVIYAGGDDLFVVGSWDRMPVLAERIRGDFGVYTGGNPYLTLSGGLALEGRKFPLYRAAERAGEAEGQAKGYERADGRSKDAFCFLGQVVAWGEEWSLLREQKDNLLWLVGEDQENKARREGEREKRLDRALLQVVRSVHYLYYTGLREARKRAMREKRPLPDPKMFLGRWAWMHAYSLARIVWRSRDEEIKRRILELQKAILQPATVHLSGLAARWAEYLLRTTGD